MGPSSRQSGWEPARTGNGTHFPSGGATCGDSSFRRPSTKNSSSRASSASTAAKPRYVRPPSLPEGTIGLLPIELDPGRYCTRCRGSHEFPCPAPGFGPRERLTNLGLDRTEFCKLYGMHALPGVRDGNDLRVMKWKESQWPAQGFDIARWLPIYADGVRDAEPLRQSAVQGFCEIVSQAGEQALVSTDLYATVRSIRNSLSHGSAEVVAHALICVNALLKAGPSVCAELASRNLLRGLLVVPSRLQHSRVHINVGYNPPRRKQLSDLVNETADLILRTGGALGRHNMRDCHLL